MRTLTDSKTAVALVAGLTLVGALAGCSTAAESVTEPDSGTGSEGSTDNGTDSGGTDSGTDTGAGSYADGTYSASGEYQSPNGTETLDVTITLQDDAITAVEVVGHGGSPNTVRFQGEFAGGIAAAVVGKRIDEISVSKIAGSSLASGGFNAAVEQIKADAAQ
jgi:uncharacterized protein with FMN-binding domain